LIGHIDYVLTVLFYETENRGYKLITGSRDGSIKFWDEDNFKKPLLTVGKQ